MENLLYLFPIIPLLGFMAVPLLIIESIAIMAMAKWAFQIGIPIRQVTLNTNISNLTLSEGETIEMKEGKFYTTKDLQILFRSRNRFFDFKLNTPFPFKAIATVISENEVKVVARLPLGPTLFMIPFILTVMFIPFVAIMFVIGYAVENSRFEKMVDELDAILRGQY
jgi:hypothetical protein